jgi:phenylpropionate dioxygenase-like ring-hydroxylating dioxygenase large terminal subunit
MQFAPSGRCVNMPSMPIVPSNASVRSFPIVDRAPIVWIWMGDPDRADESLIPDTWWLASPEWASVRGSFMLRTDYLNMHENLLDQTHFPFLHPDTVGTPEYARSKLDARLEGNKVVIDRALRNSPPPAVYGVPLGLMGQRVDRFSEARFVSPALHTAYARIVDNNDPSGSPRTYRFNISHIITPETNNRINYWWFSSRDCLIDDPKADEHIFNGSVKAYTEDVDALEWISDVVQSDEEPQFDLSFAPDKPALMMRRIIFDLAREEAQRSR